MTEKLIPGYMDHIVSVSQDDFQELSQGADTIYTMLQHRWTALEDLAKNEGYDIFAIVPSLIGELRRLLYVVEAQAIQLEYSFLLARDLATLKEKDAEYGGSWLKRGGQGAFMMLARKWDRIENQVAKAAGVTLVHLCCADTRKEGLLDDIADLRCYLLLVEGEMRASAARGYGFHRNDAIPRSTTGM